VSEKKAEQRLGETKPGDGDGDTCSVLLRSGFLTTRPAGSVLPGASRWVGVLIILQGGTFFQWLSLSYSRLA
jgi:hypothetical protein